MSKAHIAMELGNHKISFYFSSFIAIMQHNDNHIQRMPIFQD